MRKDSLVIFVTSLVLTLGIVGGAHYLYLQNLKKVPVEVKVKPPSDIATGKPYLPPVRPAVRRTATAIKCIKSDGTVFYTNATRCKDADLNNRISIADPVKPTSKWAGYIYRQKYRQKPVSRVTVLNETHDS